MEMELKDVRWDVDGLLTVDAKQRLHIGCNDGQNYSCIMCNSCYHSYLLDDHGRKWTGAGSSS